MGGWWFGPRYYGGGCLNGLMGSVFAIVIVIVVLIAFIGSSITEVTNGGSVQYDEAKLQEYTDRQYAQIFGDTAYEDNLLIVFLTMEDHYDYCYIAWLGDHIDPEIAELLGDNTTELGRAMATNISDTDYRYSLDTDLGRVIKRLAQKIESLDLESSFICQEENANAPSKLINHTDLPMTEETVNQALTQFTEKTGIPCAIVVEDAEDVFGRSMSGFSIVTLIILGVAVICLVSSLLKNKKRKEETWN